MFGQTQGYNPSVRDYSVVSHNSCNGFGTDPEPNQLSKRQ